MTKKLLIVSCALALVVSIIFIKKNLTIYKEIQLTPGKGIVFAKASYVARDIHDGKIRDWPEENLIDNDLASHWCATDNTGEWIYIALDKDFSLSKIGIANGNGYWKHPKYGDKYIMDARIKEIQLELSNGWKKIVFLKDTGDLQFFNLNNQKSNYVKLTIRSLYPMTKWSHVCLSEIQLFAREKKDIENSPSIYDTYNPKDIKDPQLPAIINSLQEEISANPKDFQKHIMLGKLFFKANLFLNALKEFKTASSLDPNNGEIYYLKAITHLKLGEITYSVNAISKSLDIFSAKGKEEEFKNAFLFLRKLQKRLYIDKNRRILY